MISKASTDMNQELLKTGDCRHPTGDAWGKPVFEVNAYYYPDENRFLLPAAILRPPFYDPSKPLTWNYGAIGATIGHELCHAFDSDGRVYDENGDKRDWWTERDDREYKQRAKAVIRLYETRDYRGHPVDGTLTLVENIADIGGLEFALEGLKAALGHPLKKEELREFFTSFAVSWRAKDRLKRAVELLVTDPHSPPMLRVNHVVRQFDEWYEAFDVAPESEGWIAPADRIHFFR
jgi:predicted metalloendopeptidase